MTAQLELSPEVERAIEEAVQREIDRRLLGISRGWSHERMVAAIERIRERRKSIALPADVVDALIEEHRKEFGRGPLIDESDDA